MQGNKKFVLGVVLGFTMAATAIFGSAANSQPGSDADPLVSKSYVDQKIAELSASLGTGGTGVPGTGTTDTAAINQLKTDVGDLTHFIIDALTELESHKSRLTSLESGFVVVEVDAGKTVLLSGGAELVLRSGTATAINGTNGGLANVTTGIDIKNGAAVPAQHMILSSRSDGRGIKIGTQKAFLLVRGGYTVK